MDALQLEVPYRNTLEYKKESNYNDLRNLAISKGEQNYKLERYIQVFEQNHGFIPNLSILDVLFMEGPNALNYLESQKITF